MRRQQDILSESGDDQLLQGTAVIYGGTATFAAGVGEKAKADARIILEGVKNRVSESKQKQSNYVVWQKMEDSGQVVETLTVPGFQGPTAPKFSAPGGLTVQLPASSDFKTQVQKLSSQAGQGYMNDLMARKDVNWQPVKLAYDKWDYKQEGLTPAGAALVAVAVTWALGPGGAGVIGNTTTTAGLMADAAFASLASQATISLINNKGDLGKTLKELGSSQVAKATIAAALTAGVIHKLGATSTMQDLAKKTTFPEKLTYNLINATGRALTNTAINGGDLEEALKQALIGGVVDTAHGEVASQIKGLESQYLAHKLAHALAGCVAGAAAQGTCRDGAIGAAVGEVVAELMPPGNKMFYTEVEKSNVLALSKLVAGATAAYAGGDAQTAITTAETAVRSNALFMVPLVALLMSGAYLTYAGDGNTLEGLQLLGQGNDPLSKAIANGSDKLVSLSMSTFPKETTATLNFLNWVGGNVGQVVNATVTYVDDKTGKVVSTQWNNLSPSTRDALIGAGKVTSVVVGASGVQSLRSFFANPRAVKWTPNISLRGASWEKYLENNSYKNYLPLNDLQPNHKAFDFFDPETGHAVSAKSMDTLGLTNEAGTPMTAANAERYLRKYINDAKKYVPPKNQPNAIPARDIKSRSIELAIPHGTPANVRQALETAAAYGRAEGVQVRITVVRK